MVANLGTSSLKADLPDLWDFMISMEPQQQLEGL
jgi:hypothetical protein